MMDMDEQEVRRRLQGISEFQVNPEVTARDLAQVRQKLAEAARSQTSHRGYLWRTIRTHKLMKYTTAAGVMAAFLIGMNFFSGSPDGISLAWGDIREAILAQSWVHVKYDNGREEWMNIDEGKHFVIHQNGPRSVLDRTLNIRREHSLNNNYILEVTPTVYPDGMAPPWEPSIYWEVLLGYLEQGEASASGRYTDVEGHMEAMDGQDTARFDVYYLDILDNRVLTTQIWADPETQLPLHIRHRLPLGVRQKWETEYMPGEYDFPDTGPTSIFDLGVPHDVEIVSRVAKANRFSTETQQILEAGERAARNFPQQYRALV